MSFTLHRLAELPSYERSVISPSFPLVSLAHIKCSSFSCCCYFSCCCCPSCPSCSSCSSSRRCVQVALSSRAAGAPSPSSAPLALPPPSLCRRVAKLARVEAELTREGTGQRAEALPV